MTALRKIVCGTLARPAHLVDEPTLRGRGGARSLAFWSSSTPQTNRRRQRRRLAPKRDTMRGHSMLRHRWFFVAVVCLGVALGLPSLKVGFVADDYTFIQRLEDRGQSATLRLYEFATGQPGQAARLQSARWVAYPWWIENDFKVRFLRPLSSALFALDHALFGRAPLGYHVHSLLWFALLLVAVGLLLRRVCAPTTWQLPFLLFALNAGHAESLAWVSSRNALVSTVPALFGLLALLEYYQRGWRFGLPLGGSRSVFWAEKWRCPWSAIGSCTAPSACRGRAAFDGVRCAWRCRWRAWRRTSCSTKRSATASRVAGRTWIPSRRRARFGRRCPGASPCCSPRSGPAFLRIFR
jgi:hypothetical protein